MEIVKIPARSAVTALLVTREELLGEFFPQDADIIRKNDNKHFIRYEHDYSLPWKHFFLLVEKN